MNHLIADNKVSTLRAYLIEKLQGCYDARDAGNLVQQLFEAYNGWSRTEVVMNAEQRLGESELLRYHFALKRLLNHEPIQYILGYAWFLDVQLEVGPSVLIPRPETEELVRLIGERNTQQNPRILDVGTGSGCIAIALKKIIPAADVTALDVSDDALRLARRNAEKLDVEIDFLRMDILEAYPQKTYDIIVSNPPYIPKMEQESMARRVTEHEPHLALFTDDADALVFYRRLMELTPALLTNGGQVFCEIHEQMATSLMELASLLSIQSPEIHDDMQGKNRMMSWNYQPNRP
jgi:release factor glutamine methyltransferase